MTEAAMVLRLALEFIWFLSVLALVPLVAWLVVDIARQVRERRPR